MHFCVQIGLLLLALWPTARSEQCTLPGAEFLQSSGVVPAAKRIASYASTSPAQKHIVVTISDWMYRPILLNWMVHMHYNNVLEYLVLCLDQKTLDLVGHWSKGGHGILIPECHERLDIFRFRHIMVQALLKEDYIVVLVDADCIWLRNALPWILPLSQRADIVAQMGFAPNKTFYRRGVTACAGFLTLMPTASTRHFYHTYLRGLGAGVDDQWLLNSVLERHCAFTFADNETNYFFNQKDVLISKPPAAGYAQFSIRLGLLPYHRFPRMNDLTVFREDDPIVWHNTKNWSVPQKPGPKGNRARDKQWLIDGKLVNITWVNVSMSKVVSRKEAMKKAGVFALVNTPWANLKSFSELPSFFACIDMKALQDMREAKLYVDGKRLGSFPPMSSDTTSLSTSSPGNSFSVWCKMS